MAAGATIHTFTVTLADVDRGVYEDLSLRVARHPSETDVYMLTRVLAYGLEFAEGIAFTEGISATDEPAVVIRDATGSPSSSPAGRASASIAGPTSWCTASTAGSSRPHPRTSSVARRWACR